MNERYCFRGKRADNGEWSYGAYLEQYHSQRSGRIDAIFCSDETKTHRYAAGCGTVGQCAGLRDKNGTLIFEGDILRFYEHYTEPDGELDDADSRDIQPVVWCGWRDYPAFDLADHDFDSNGLSALFGAGYSVEVIGNVHDDPGLLPQWRGRDKP